MQCHRSSLLISSLSPSSVFSYFCFFNLFILLLCFLYFIGYARGSVYYYENMEGGHGGAADNKQQAFMSTLYLDFLWNTIGKKWGNYKDKDEVEDEDENYCPCHSLHCYAKLLYSRQCFAAICHDSSILLAHWLLILPHILNAVT